jgi:hypothetical protein
VVVNGDDVLLVADEAAGGEAGGQIPEAELAVPGAGQCELAVRAKDDVLDEVGAVAKAAVGRPGLEPPYRCHHHGPPLSPPRLEVEEEEENGGWRRKKEEAAPLRCGTGFTTEWEWPVRRQKGTP